MRDFSTQSLILPFPCEFVVRVNDSPFVLTWCGSRLKSRLSGEDLAVLMRWEDFVFQSMLFDENLPLVNSCDPGSCATWWNKG